MNQALEIDIKSGFNPKKEDHLLWIIKTRLIEKDREMRIYNNKAVITENVVAKNIYRERREKALGAYLELKGLLDVIDNEVIPSYYCCRCGYLNVDDVTYDEKCSICGGSLPL